jgi:hypothetical protein
MDDLTIIYISASRMPDKWVKFQLDNLFNAIGDTPIISITRKPLNLGINLIDSEKKCYWNIYRQMLRAAKIAKSKYVAMAEDDTLYSKEHFSEYRPPDDACSYNWARWILFQWNPEMYSIRQRVSNCTLIAPREYLIDALQEREDKYPNGHHWCGEVGRNKVEKRLRLPKRNSTKWFSTVPVIQLNHRTGTDTGGGPGTGRTKRHGQIKAYDIPYWGKAENIGKHYA